MQIISGIARGTKLLSPEGERTRPTLQRVKEALFSAIQFDIPGRVVFEPFGGTAQLSLEAISRGAARAYICETDPNALSIIKKNIARTRFDKMVKLYPADAEKTVLKLPEKISLVFLDPPYAYDGAEFIKKLCEQDIMTDDAMILYESAKEAVLPEQIGDFVLVKTYRHSHTAINKYIKADVER